MKGREGKGRRWEERMIDGNGICISYHYSDGVFQVSRLRVIHNIITTIMYSIYNNHMNQKRKKEKKKNW